MFVAGASGAIGGRLIPPLTDAGHDVIGTHNSPTSAELLRTLGAKPVMLDLLDARAVREAVREAKPDAIVHQATALANVKFSRNMDKVTAKTSELRTKGTDALLAAARESGVRRFVAQSVAAFSRYVREGGPIKTEDDPLDPTPPKNFHRSAAAIAYLSRRSPTSAESRFATAPSTAPATTGRSSRCASGSFRSSATEAASGPGFTSTTPCGVR